MIMIRTASFVRFWPETYLFGVNPSSVIYIGPSSILSERLTKCQLLFTRRLSMTLIQIRFALSCELHRRAETGYSWTLGYLALKRRRFGHLGRGDTIQKLSHRLRSALSDPPTPETGILLLWLSSTSKKERFSIFFFLKKKNKQKGGTRESILIKCQTLVGEIFLLLKKKP